jgi:GTP-binding protein Era
MTFKSGFIAIAGPPNVGKSTLLNRIAGAKISIVSPKPQTTRNRVTGILNGTDFQMVFVDTPGIHKTRTALHQSMVSSALATFSEVDIVLFMIQMGARKEEDMPSLLDNLRGIKKPVFLIINKIDKVNKEKVLPIIDEYGRLHSFREIIPISALKGYGVDKLLEELKTRLAPGPQFFPPDMQTDQTEDFWISEVIREKLYFHIRQEVPYSCAVVIDNVEDVQGKDLLRIAARICVETDSQKGIVIGQGGRMIKSIGRSARLELEKIFGTGVFLDLVVRVEKNWSKDTRALRRLGY